MTEETLKRMLIDNIGIREFAEELGTEIGDIICDNISCQRCMFQGHLDCEKKLRKYCRKMFAGGDRRKHPHTRMALYDMAVNQSHARSAAMNTAGMTRRRTFTGKSNSACIAA